MKYYSRLQEYKASNLVVRIGPLQAYSYGWWQFLTEQNGLIVLNMYNYSQTTLKHQYKVRKLLDSLGITPDIVVYTAHSLDSKYWVQDAIRLAIHEMNVLRDDMNKPRTRASTNEQRQRDWEAKAAYISELQVKLINEEQGVA